MADMGRPLKFKDAKEIEDKAEEYFKYCDEHDKPYTMTGLAIALDTDRKTLLNYGNKEDFFLTLKKIKSRVENYAEEQLYRNGNTAGVIFNLKNNYGWVDKQEVDAKVQSEIVVDIDYEENND